MTGAEALIESLLQEQVEHILDTPARRSARPWTP